jgi:hypothetical protein
MEGHNIIYLVFVLGYLYFLARVIDRYNVLIKKRSKIRKPRDNRKESKEIWMRQVREIQHEMKMLFKRSMLLILAVPVVEVVCHLLLGEYQPSDQLLTLIFFLFFLAVLALTLYIMKSRGDILFKRKFDWELIEEQFNADSESS